MMRTPLLVVAIMVALTDAQNGTKKRVIRYRWGEGDTEAQPSKQDLFPACKTTMEVASGVNAAFFMEPGRSACPTSSAMEASCAARDSASWNTQAAHRTTDRVHVTRTCWCGSAQLITHVHRAKAMAAVTRLAYHATPRAATTNPKTSLAFYPSLVRFSNKYQV
ncbi:uncharacterized protein LOC144119340 isoform X1 [Amblyomma americanum]